MDEKNKPPAIRESVTIKTNDPLRSENDRGFCFISFSVSSAFSLRIGLIFEFYQIQREKKPELSTGRVEIRTRERE